jgi:aldehyde:ferredoxin oxidoreductase
MPEGHGEDQTLKGVNNKILHVDLTNMEFTIEEPGELFYRTYFGGRGFALKYMLDRIPPGADPLAPENMIVFATSVLVGAPGPAIPRLITCAKSPITGAYGESEAGGWWAPALKKAGFDAVTVSGRAPYPVYIWIKDGNVEFRDAGHLWGHETGYVQDAIRSELGDRMVRVVQTGPGGERLIRFANIVNELAHFNGRAGMGAVMGSKNLKAIAVRGTMDLEFADVKRIREINRWAATEGLKHPAGSLLHKYGTTALVRTMNAAGFLPTENFNKGTFSGVEQITAESLHETIYDTPGGCYACPIRCKRRARVEGDGFTVDPRYGGPEYETITAITSLLGISDPTILARVNQLCSQNTLDTISLGMTIAFAMECYENGLLTEKDCDGLSLRFGNSDAVLPIVEKIIKREGIGDLLAEGSLRAAQRIGPESYRFLLQVKGQEVPMHDPRSKTGVGLQYALADYGADHLKAVHDPTYATDKSPGVREATLLGIYEPIDPVSLGPEKARFYYYMSLYWGMLDMLGACTFGFVPRGPIPLEMLRDLVDAVTGWKVSYWELLKASERGLNLSRVFNIRESLTRHDDRLPEKFFSDLSDKEGTAIDRKVFKETQELCYEMMGWDPYTARPTRAKLAELGIPWAEKYML